MENLALQTLSDVEKSRLEMLCTAARTLLDWNLPIEVIIEITKLSKEDIENLKTTTPGIDEQDEE
ncbi:MAG: hypothetical protein FWG52_01555 [Proteobacteria bacterium]|nr:hypothetical protein [Betaproteobacteria bacterium]MCL1860207.1 hypothetical protein [Pseudomonadota bacterium]